MNNFGIPINYRVLARCYVILRRWEVACYSMTGFDLIISQKPSSERW